VGVITSQAAEAELEARIEAMARARVAAPAPAPAPQSPARHLPPPPPGSPRQPPPPQWAPAAAPPHVPELWELPTVRRVIAPLNGHRRHHSRPLASLTECAPLPLLCCSGGAVTLQAGHLLSRDPGCPRSRASAASAALQSLLSGGARGGMHVLTRLGWRGGGGGAVCLSAVCRRCW
jgi:hypothetical protein